MDTSRLTCGHCARTYIRDHFPLPAGVVLSDSPRAWRSRLSGPALQNHLDSCTQCSASGIMLVIMANLTPDKRPTLRRRTSM